MTGSNTQFGLGTAAAREERRSEKRLQASGEVRFLLSGAQPLEIPARLLDLSAHGMRAEHMYAALNTGMMLQVHLGTKEYTARVVWNRIKDDGVETGFYLL